MESSRLGLLADLLDSDKVGWNNNWFECLDFGFEIYSWFSVWAVDSQGKNGRLSCNVNAGVGWIIDRKIFGDLWDILRSDSSV